MLRSILLVFALTCSYVASAFVAEPVPQTLTATVFQQIDKTQLSHQLGRSLTLKERLVVNTFNKRQLSSLRKANKRALKGLPPKVANSDRNGMAIAGFVCGLVGLLLFPIVLPQLAIIFSAIGLRKSNREGAPHRGLAIAGLITGILGSWLFVLVLIVLIAAIAGA